MKNLTQPHEPIDARDVRSKPILMEGARAGHVLVKNERQALPLKKLRMVSVFGYDATVPATKNTDKLFELGYMSSKEMGQAVLGREYRFDQAARGGTIVAGGRAGTNAPAYISDVGYFSPFSFKRCSIVMATFSCPHMFPNRIPISSVHANVALLPSP